MNISQLLAQKDAPIVTLASTASLTEALSLMKAKEIGSVAVQDSADEPIIGMVSQTELVDALDFGRKAAFDYPLSRVMKRRFLVCDADESAASVMNRMTLSRQRHVIVCANDGRICGLVSLGDLVAAMLAEAKMEVGVLRDMARSRIVSAVA